MTAKLPQSDRKEIAEILDRRSREIADFKHKYQRDENHFGSVELALSREISRLRGLAIKVNPPKPDKDE